MGNSEKTVSEPTKVSESSESAVPSTQSSLSETDAQVTNETAETAPHTPTETTTKDATGAVVKESEENALSMKSQLCPRKPRKKLIKNRPQ